MALRKKILQVLLKGDYDKNKNLFGQFKVLPKGQINSDELLAPEKNKNNN